MSSPASYTIAQFCDAYHISRSHYYVLKKQGNGPQEVRLGTSVIIYRSCAEKWEQQMLSQQTISQGFIAL